MNFNKFKFKPTDRVMVDATHANRCEVTIIDFTQPSEMYATVKADDGYQWQTMTNRLTPIVQK